MYRAVITDLGRARLAEAENSSMHRALAALSPSLEAAHPRALFDAFCVRLHECWDVPHTTDECRGLWRVLRDQGWIAVRGSLDVDAGRAFAGTVSWGERATPAHDRSSKRTPGPSPTAAASALLAAPLFPRPVAIRLRALLVCLQTAMDEE